MHVKVAKTAGFCWGVRRTVDQLMDVARRAAGAGGHARPHHPQPAVRVPHPRRWAWARSSAVAEVEAGTTVVVRTHGAVKPELDAARERGLEVVDGTCPYVKYPQAMAQRLSHQGYHLVIVGDPNHAEVKGVVSYGEGPCTVVKPGGAEIPAIDAKKVAVIAQTTCIGADFERVVGALALRHKEVRAVNTICTDTDERQADARQLAAEVDAVVVVGGKNSANTRHLAEICQEIQPRTWHVETEEELRPEWFDGCAVVGVSAGASTPDWVIDGVAARLGAMRAAGPRLTQ